MARLSFLVSASIVASVVRGQTLFTESPTATPGTPSPTTAAPVASATLAPVAVTDAPVPSLVTAAPVPSLVTAAPEPSVGTEAPVPSLVTAAPVASQVTAAPTTPAPTTGMPVTNPPSDIPSSMPSSKPSNSPTAPAPSSSPTEDTFVTFPLDEPCNGLCSNTYDSLQSIRTAVGLIAISGTICLCPSTFAPETGNCESDENESPSIVIGDGQDVTLECVSPLGAKCIFACPNTLVRVRSGGSLTLLGGNNTLMTGGTSYSRIHVDEGGTAVVEGVQFSNTAASAARRLQANGETISADGMGGGISNRGTLEVRSSNFNNCSASLFGGAIYSDGNARVSDSSFTNNVAPTGGAIFASGFLDIRNCAFSGNVASDNGASLAGDAELEACGNFGLAGGGPCAGDSAATSRRGRWLRSLYGSWIGIVPIMAASAWAL